jgi:hypothetical protein
LENGFQQRSPGKANVEFPWLMPNHHGFLRKEMRKTILFLSQQRAMIPREKMMKFRNQCVIPHRSGKAVSIVPPQMTDDIAGLAFHYVHRLKFQRTFSNAR